MSGTKVEGATSTNLLEVNSANELKTTLSQSEATAGYAAATSEIDGGSYTGIRLMRDLEAADDFRVRVSSDGYMWSEFFPGSTINSGVWQYAVTTMTFTVASGFATLNAGSSTASAAVARLQTYRGFPIYVSTPTLVDFTIKFPAMPVSSNVCEWGVGLCTGTAAPTDGVFWRIQPTGELLGVVNNNGVETMSQQIPFSRIGTNTTRHTRISIFGLSATFWIDDVIVATIELPMGASTLTATPNLPAFARTYNVGATPAVQQMIISMVGVVVGDMLTNKPWSHIMCGGGGHSSQGQTAGAVIGSTASYGNNTNPVAQTPTNTTMALTLIANTGLGGNFWSTTTLTPGTDGVISDYVVPLGTAARPGKSLYIDAVWVDTVINAAVTLGASPIILQWNLLTGGTQVDLTVAESATTKAGRANVIGFQQFTVGTLGTSGGRLSQKFESPICIQPGEHVIVTYRNLGAAGSAGSLAHVIGFNGYWE